jgi:hypothetical protein
MTWPGLVHGPVVVGATRLARDIKPFFQVDPDNAGQEHATPRAVADALGIKESIVALPAIRSAPLGSLLEPLRALIRQHEPDRIYGGIGQTVSEIWRCSDGRDVPIQYVLAPGEHEGRLSDAATGEPLTEVHLCRSLHTVSSVELCTSCLSSTCAACEDRARACTLCGAASCGTCVSADGRCPACAALRRAGLFGKRRAGAGRGDDAWVGRSGRAEVHVVRIADEWFIDRSDLTGTYRAKVDPEQLLSRIRGFLDR